MRGFPKYVATKVDVENLRGLFPEDLAKYEKSLYDGAFMRVPKAGVVTVVDTEKDTEIIFDELSQFKRLGFKKPVGAEEPVEK